MGRRQCCCQGCELGSDEFSERSDGPVPEHDPKWKDIAETWEFDHGHLVSSGEGPIVTRIRRHRRAKQPPAEKLFNYVVYFKAVNLGHPSQENPNLIDEFGVIIRYQDSSNFDWVKFELNATGTAVWPSFIRRTSGSDTVLMDKNSHPDGAAFSIAQDGSFTGRICYADVEWSVTPVPEVEYVWTLCGGGTNDLPIGSGVVGFLYGRYDEWALWDHWEVDREECPYCSCFCLNQNDDSDYKCIPEELTATIVPVHDPGDYSAPNIDFKEITLRQTMVLASGTAPRDLSPVKRYWRATEDIDLNYHPTDNLWVYCEGGRMKIRTQFLSLGWVDPPDGEGYYPADWNDSTCRPVHLVFRSLGASLKQCELPGGKYGVHLQADPDSDCLEDTPENNAFLQSLRWRIEVEE